MAMDDDYETISHLMRGQAQESSGPSSDANLNKSINELNKSIKGLLSLFTDVKKELLDEYEQNKGKGNFPVMQDNRVQQLEQKTDTLMEQNKHIAESIIALSDKIDAMHEKKQELYDHDIERQLNEMKTSSPMMPDLDFQEDKHVETFGAPVIQEPEPKYPDFVHDEFEKVPDTIHFGQTPTAGSLSISPVKPTIPDFTPPVPPRTGRIDPGYPSVEGYPSVGQSQMTQVLNVEPRQPKKKFMGMF